MRPQRDVTDQHEFRRDRATTAWISVCSFIAFLLSVMVSGSVTFAAGVTSQKPGAAKPNETLTEAILKDALDLTGREADAERAIRRLRARPRTQVIEVTREVLAHPRSPGAVDSILRAVVSLELKEVAPDVRALAEKSDYWRVIHTLNRLHASDFEKSKGFPERSSLSAFYLKRLSDTLPVPTKMALIDGLALMKTAIPNALFRTLLEDPSYQVRQAAAQNFVVTRDVYSKSDQLERFKWVFTTKPYQLRLDAMDAFGRMPASERQALSAAVQPTLCEKETNPVVQKACRDLLPKHSKGSGQ